MPQRDDIIVAARSMPAMPYRLDPPPDGLTSIDCSLYVLKVLARAGVPIPGVRTAEQIRQASIPVGWSDVQPGDLLFFEGTYDAAGPAGPDGRIASHVGISEGAGTHRMWDAHERAADPSNAIAETDILTDYWQPKLFEARRPPGLEVEVLPDPAAPWPRGIDVSSHQGTIDWSEVAASGVLFAITKATEGTAYTNPTFGANWHGIKAAGLRRGAYHWGDPENDAAADASYFITRILQEGGPLEVGDVLVLDAEEGSGDVGKWSSEFVDAIRDLVGFDPLIYTGRWFSDPHGFADEGRLKQCGLWLADYRTDISQVPDAPDPWESVAIWQYSSSGMVPGIQGPVDLNYFLGPISRFDLYGKPPAGQEGQIDHPTEPDPPESRDWRTDFIVTTGYVRGDLASAVEAHIDDPKELMNVVRTMRTIGL